MVVLSRVLLLALVFLVASATLVHAKGKKPAPEEEGDQGDEGDELVPHDQWKTAAFFSGSIHYPRSTVEMWPDLLKKAKQGGLNVIETYVFWNLHEPVKGKFNFEGNADVVKFIRLVQEHKMYVTLRVGPFIQAEWNHGGLPYWLREEPDIIFRSDNPSYKHHMEAFVTKIIAMMKHEKLFAHREIENEYTHVQLAYKELGNSYVQWAANMALSQNAGVPWIMCKQKDAPDPVINTCNGRHCGDTFTGPNKPHKPTLWTENWTAQYRVFGDPPSQRSAEDIAFSVARFFSKDGTLTNYYMYHGGTNFGRTSAVFTTTRYYDEAPLDEYGLQREPKWGHLKDLHRALNLCKKPLFAGTPGVQRLGKETEARFYERPGTDMCVAFLANNHSTIETTVNWRGQEYFLPPHSISILPDCKTVNPFQPSCKPSQRQETTGTYHLLKDATDYGWFTSSLELGPYDLPMKESICPVLRIPSLGHAMSVFVNGEYVGTEHGSHAEKGFVFERPVTFKQGVNHISLLCMTVGLPDSGAYMEHRYAGPRSITVLGLNTGTIDLSQNGWGHRVGLNGENLQVFTKMGAQKVQWTKAAGKGRALTWYKTNFEAPEGKEPVAIRMAGMGKGMVWVNGQSIGRYWMSFLSPLGQPTQSEYHIPRAFITPGQNFLVVLEEQEADPKDIEILTVNRDTICAISTEMHPPHVKSWERKGGELKTVGPVSEPVLSSSVQTSKRLLLWTLQALALLRACVEPTNLANATLRQPGRLLKSIAWDGLHVQSLWTPSFSSKLILAQISTSRHLLSK
ncbi:beta-galactosidase 11 [Prunus yedoensis var. nudiflora]|uniref:beta-galactosidase n=1 Tax=Prunus yedoensis var. nudiflora TaxID=2094558 RepID=A0A314Z6U0_PRUYE|nr:beta-galactosidase 11 [Prunus yedoensis var. nudiflora]